MKKLVSFLFVGLLVVQSFAQEKIVYDANAEERTLSGGFNAIKISHGIELLLKQGDTEALAISAEEKEHRDAVKTEVVDGELQIYIEQNLEKWWKQLRSKGKKVKAYVSFKTLQHLRGSSGAKITIDGLLSSNDLAVDLSSGAFFKGELKVSKLAIEQSSGATCNLSGRADVLEVKSSSGAHFYGYDLTADKGKANASSGGKIELRVEKELVANASSGGGIEYKGNTVSRDVSSSSGGKIRKAG